MSPGSGTAPAPGTRPRVAVVGLDGTPHGFLRRLLADGVMPNLARILEGGTAHRMESVYPTVSSVAWASFMTGTGPGEHNIYGFVDRRPGTYDLYFPNARHLRAPTLWDHLQRHGRRQFVMNVPVTYPTREVAGVMIGCFLCADIERVSTDPRVVRWLKQHGYRIDVDARLARSDKGAFLSDLEETLARREEAMFHFLGLEPWDYFQCHVMETDRLQHFLWEEMEQGDRRYLDRFLGIYRRVDGMLGRLRRELPAEVPLVLLSDHGFCGIRQEVFLNRYLIERGFLRMREGSSEMLGDIDAAHTEAYSLIPGRIYVNLEGREPAGIVPAGAAYEAVRARLEAALRELRGPEGEPVVAAVHRREDLYTGAAAEAAPDLLVVPRDGFDLKGRFRSPSLFARSPLNGMHTHQDAVLCCDRPLATPPASIRDVLPVLLEMMELPAIGPA
ncbi:MAG: alkaline phosphatase family protein [Acidobacteriota bacterium]